MPSKVFRYSMLSGQFVFATAILLMAIGCRQSKPIPAEIVGDSMAPLLCGEHLSQCCPQCDCAFVWRTGRDIKTVQCSNCGSKFAPQGKTLPADRVQVTPGQVPQRWDIIAFEHNGSTMIKRVVGLPGETVSIAGGNIIIDENVAVKPNTIATQTQHLVFDSQQRVPANQIDPANPIAQARYEFDADHWESEKRTLLHRPRETSDQSFDWINYRHQRNYPHFNKAADEAAPIDWPAIQDNNSYNQNVGRKLNDVHELAIQLDLKVQHGSTFKIDRTRPQGPYFLTLRVDKSSPQYKIELCNGQSVAAASGTLKTAGEGPFEMSLLFSNIDGRAKVAIDGEVLVDERDQFEGRAIPLDVSGTKLKFGFSDTSWGSVTRCRIWRDIHYFAQAGPPKFELPLTLGQGEYFVLGDNVAVSRDSRHFGPIKKLIGVVQP